MHKLIQFCTGKHYLKKKTMYVCNYISDTLERLVTAVTGITVANS